MCKKLLVFSLTFCFGLISFQFLKLKMESASQETTQALIQNPVQATQNVQPNDYIVSTRNCLSNLQTALASDDRNTVVSLINFPIEIGFKNKKNRSYSVKFKNEAEFLRNYDKIFDSSYKQFIAELTYRNLYYSTSGEMFVNRSELRFARFHKENSENFEVKIISINKYSTYK
jgi:hypothetical protein